MKEYPLTPLENALMKRVSGGTVTETSIKELFEKKSRPLQIEAQCPCECHSWSYDFKGVYRSDRR